jgi:hypothetical protein
MRISCAACCASWCMRDMRCWPSSPEDAWSREQLVSEQGPGAGDAWRTFYPELSVTRVAKAFAIEEALDGVDLVIVHEWNAPELVARIGALRRRGAAFLLLFHDTHHRAVSEPDAIRHFDLAAYDGVLAFGEALASVYRRWGWGRARVRVARGGRYPAVPPAGEEKAREGLVWIGNWGDGERASEITRVPAGARAGGRPAARHSWRALSGRGAGADQRARRALPGLAANSAVPRSSRATWRPCMCRGASMPRRCPAFRPSACSRRSPAASRWSRPPGRQRGAVHASGTDYLIAQKRPEMTQAPARARRRSRTAPVSLRRNGLATIHSATAAPTARGTARHRPAAGRQHAGDRMMDRLLWIEPAVFLLERCGHLLPRAAAGARAASAMTSPSTSPTP